MLNPRLLAVAAAFVLSACSAAPDFEGPAGDGATAASTVTYANVLEANYGPTLKFPWRPEWNTFLSEAIGKYGTDLIGGSNEPVAAMKTLCPKYGAASVDEKKAIWALFFAELARYESGFKPDDSFDEPGQTMVVNGRRVQKTSVGLLALSDDDYQRHPRTCFKGANLKDPKTNLVCGIGIFASQIRGPASRPKLRGVLFPPATPNNPANPRGYYYWSVLTAKEALIRADFQRDANREGVALKNCL